MPALNSVLLAFVNSTTQVDTDSSLLNNHRMVSIDERKAIRRANVALLLDKHGQTKLAEMTDIPPAYLYQFGKAKGKSIRNVNDNYARAIEEALELPAGWLDVDRSAPMSVSEPIGFSLDEEPDDLDARQVEIPRFAVTGSMGLGIPLPDMETITSSIRVNPEWVRTTLPNITGAGNLAIITGYGDSMAPTFSDGSN